MRFRLISFGRMSRAPMRLPHDRYTELTMRTGPLPSPALGSTRRGVPEAVRRTLTGPLACPIGRFEEGQRPHHAGLFAWP